VAVETITGMSRAMWNAGTLNSAYQAAIASWLQLPDSNEYVSSSVVSSSGDEYMRMLQDGRGSITIQTTITIANGVQTQIRASLLNTDIVNTIGKVIGVGFTPGAFSFLETATPTVATTAAPSGVGDANANNLGSTSTQTNGLPTTTIVAIVVVMIVLAIVGAYILYNQSKKKVDLRGSNIAAVYDSYSGRGDRFGATNPVVSGFAPHIARGNPAQRYSGTSQNGGRRSMGNSIELADYRASGYGDADSRNVMSDNPHFASPRLSLTRKSLAEHQMRSLAAAGQGQSPKYLLQQSGAPRQVNRL